LEGKRGCGFQGFEGGTKVRSFKPFPTKKCPGLFEKRKRPRKKKGTAKQKSITSRLIEKLQKKKSPRAPETGETFSYEIDERGGGGVSPGKGGIAVSGGRARWGKGRQVWMPHGVPLNYLDQNRPSEKKKKGKADTGFGEKPSGFHEETSH